ARVCQRMSIPTPPRGYWAQLRFGKVSPRPALPEPRPSDELIWTRGEYWARASAPLPKPPAEGVMRVMRRRKNRTEPHALIQGAKRHFLDARVVDNGYLRPRKWTLVDLFVTKET